MFKPVMTREEAKDFATMWAIGHWGGKKKQIALDALKRVDLEGDARTRIATALKGVD